MQIDAGVSRQNGLASAEKQPTFEHKQAFIQEKAAEILQEYLPDILGHITSILKGDCAAATMVVQRASEEKSADRFI